MPLLIGNDAALGPEWKDHPLKGEWTRYRECHIGGDFLATYRVDDAAGKGGDGSARPRAHPQRTVRQVIRRTRSHPD